MPVSRPNWSSQRLIVPVVLLLISFLGIMARHAWDWAELDPSYYVTIAVVGTWGAVLCWIAIGVWFFLFSGLKVKFRLAGLAVVLALVGVSLALIDGFVLTSELVPIPHFRWQSRAADRLAAYLEDVTSPDGLPKIDISVDPTRDYPRYRGPFGDGIARRSDLLDLEWTSGKPTELWRFPCGGGFAGFAVAGNILVTVEQRGNDEVVVCYDQKSGQQRWTYAYPASFIHATGSGPRATPTIVDGEVYSFGAIGDLVCLDARTGEPKWTINAVKDCGAKVVQWGMTSSPLVVGDLVIVNPGIDPSNNTEQALAAYHRRDGKRVWAAGKYRAGYSSPQFATLAGRPQVLLFDAGGLTGHDLKTGRELWHHPWPTFQDMNIIQPLLLGEDRVLISSEASVGCVVLKITRTGTEFNVNVAWENKFLAAKQSNPIRLGPVIYGLYNGSLVCLNLETGQRYWRGPYFGQAQLLGVGNSVLIQSEQGDLMLMTGVPVANRYTEIGRIKALAGPRTWNTPALVGRYLYMRNDQERVCYELPLRE